MKKWSMQLGAPKSRDVSLMRDSLCLIVSSIPIERSVFLRSAQIFRPYYFGILVTVVLTLGGMHPIYGQTMSSALRDRLQQLCGVTGSSVILWDVTEGKAIGGIRDEVFFTPQGVGSLIKPFLLLAYLREQRSTRTFPDGESTNGEAAVAEPVGCDKFWPCQGKVTPTCPVRCWFGPGHGRLSLKESLAVSCNQYFYQLSEQTSESALLATLRQYAILPESLTATKVWKSPLLRRLQFIEARIGLDSEVRLEPIRILLGCARILEGSPENDPSGGTQFAPEQIVSAGLALSAIKGTSQLAQQALSPDQHLAGKTGTSTAVSEGTLLPDKTDGWFLGFYPAVQPSVAVMVRYPNGLGAKHAAPLGGQALRLYLQLIHP
jgi:hypothetical protein